MARYELILLLDSLTNHFVRIMLLKLFSTSCFNPFCHICLQIREALAGKLSLRNLTSSNRTRVNASKAMHMIHKILQLAFSLSGMLPDDRCAQFTTDILNISITEYQCRTVIFNWTGFLSKEAEKK